MKKSTVELASRQSEMAHQSPGEQPVILIQTHLPKGENNAFYIDLHDLKGDPINLSFDHPPSDIINPIEMNAGDEIEFDCQDGLWHKCVLWNKRKIRQRGYSFDNYSPSVFTG